MPPETLPLIPIDYPDPDFKIRQQDGRRMIWDKVRKKFVTLSTEEWVRQNFIAYLSQIKNYPLALMAVEKEIRLGELKKRCDIVVFRDARPWMIVECKEPQVRIDERVLRQVLGYNMVLQVPYLVLTNGNATHGLKRTDEAPVLLTAMPDYR